MLNYNKTKFLKSCSKLHEINMNHGFEIAFVGYSNAGKSSVINALTNQKKLARISKTPGRTQLINFFEIVEDFRIVDLPGYGYAEAPKLIKKNWQNIIYSYLIERKILRSLVLIMDIRYPCKILDQKIIKLANKKKISILVLLNKCDKMKYQKRQYNFQETYKMLSSLSNSFKLYFFSSFKKIGILQLKIELNALYHQLLIS